MENRETLAPIVDYLGIRDGNPVIMEEFIAAAEHRDIRIFVVGGMVIASMQRTARSRDIRANAALGGLARPSYPRLPSVHWLYGHRRCLNWILRVLM